MKTFVNCLNSQFFSGRKRYSCSLCSAYRNAVPLGVKNHLRFTHNVTQTKIVAVDCLKTNPDKDYFIVMPKNALPKGYVKGKAKDTYGPAEIEVIPKISMFRHIKIRYYLLRILV